MINRKYHWNYRLTFLYIIVSFSAISQSFNISLRSNLDYVNAGLNDVWGYVDDLGSEYALVGLDTAFSVVDVTDPFTPIELFRIGGVHTTWRDIKTWSHYAFVTHDIPWSSNVFPSEGLLIVDLDSLQTPHFKRINFEIPLPGGGVDTLETAHNIYIDENGVAYLFGSNIGVGLGLASTLMFDVKTDPWNPVYLGMYTEFYLHDGMARGDTLWGGAIYNGSLVAIDVSNKQAPKQLGIKTTPNMFTHNCWISDDNKTLFTTDELPDSYVAAYDVSDLSNITELDRIQRLPDSAIVPHNTHVFGDFVVTSYYTGGVQIVDAEFPENMVEMGYYDTYPIDDKPTYNGNWGAYPYFPSGNLIVTDRTFGLFVLWSDYERAARISGFLEDSLTGQRIFNAEMSFKTIGDTIITELDGSFIYGLSSSINDTILIEEPGYYPAKIPVSFINGINDSMTIKLIPLNIGLEEELQAADVFVYPNPNDGNFSIYIEDNTLGDIINVYSVDGRLMFTSGIKPEMNYRSNLTSGLYILQIEKGNHLIAHRKFVVE